MKDDGSIEYNRMDTHRRAVDGEDEDEDFYEDERPYDPSDEDEDEAFDPSDEDEESDDLDEENDESDSELTNVDEDEEENYSLPLSISQDCLCPNPYMILPNQQSKAQHPLLRCSESHPEEMLG